MLSRKLTINEGLCLILTGTFLEMISNSSAYVVPPSFPHTEDAHVMREHKSIVYWGCNTVSPVGNFRITNITVRSQSLLVQSSLCPDLY
jgi:hypothetical protein